MLTKYLRQIILICLLFSLDIIKLKSKEVDNDASSLDANQFTENIFKKFEDIFVKSSEFCGQSDFDEKAIQLTSEEIKLIQSNKLQYVYIPDDLADAFKLLREFQPLEFNAENCIKICNNIKNGIHIVSYDILYKATEELYNFLVQIQSDNNKEQLNLLIDYIDQYKKAIENGDAIIDIDNFDNQLQRRISCKAVNNLCVYNCLKTANLSVSGNQRISGLLTANKINVKNIKADNISGTLTGPVHVDALNANNINSNLISGNLVTADNVIAKTFSSDNAEFDNLSLNTAQINQLTVGPIAKSLRAATCSPADDALCVIGNATVEGTLKTQNFEADNFTLSNINVTGDITSTNGNVSALNGTVSSSSVDTSLLISDNAKINSLGSGVVHSDNVGVLTSSTIVNADIDSNAAIDYQKLNLSNSIVNSDINSNAAIEDTKLATITTIGKVANSATTATDLNIPNAIVSRDALGNFSANNIIANITGNVTGAASLNVLKTGDTMTGPLNLSGPTSSLTVDGLMTVNGASQFTNGVPGIAANVLLVTKGPISGPNEFNSIKAAVDSIGGLSSATNPFVVKIGAGVFVEDTIVLPRFVALVGESPFSCVIEVNDPNKDIIIGAQNSSVENCLLRGATNSGKAAIVHNDMGVFRIFHCRFGKNDILVKSTAVAPSTALVVQDSSVDADSNFSIGFLLRGSLTQRSATAVTDFIWQPTTPQPQLQSFVDISGENTTFLGSAITIGSPTTIFIGGNGFNIQQGSTVRLFGVALIGFDKAFFIPNTIIGPRIEASGIYCRLNTKDLVVENPLATGSVIGALSTSTDKVDINPAANIALLLTDPESPSLTSVGPQFNGNTIDTITNISVQLQRGSNIGVMSGGELSIGIGRHVNVAEGTGYLMTGIAPNNNLKYVQWNAQSIELPANQDNILYITSDGTLNSALSTPDPINTIVVGRARTTATGILYLQQTPRQAVHTASLLDESWREALGNIYISGSIVSKNGNVQLDVTSGRYFFSTLEFLPSGGIAISWDSFYKDNMGNTVVIESQNMVDFQQYNDLTSGTLAPIPVGQFARHSLYVVGDGSTEKYLFVYSQQTYATLNDAQEGTLPTQPSTWGANIVLIASIIVQNTGLPNASSISQITDERPRLGFKANSVAGTDIHGDLLGLLADDHPQYLLVNGTRAMSGNLDMASSNINNVGQVNGVIIQAHADRHLPTGADPLAIAAPVSIGTSNQIGTQASFALSDHVHDHGSLPGGNLHALATPVTAGFMSAADKTLLDNLNPSNFVQKSGDTITGTLSLIPNAGTALSASGNAGVPVITLNPEANSSGIAIGSTTGNALEINADKFTVVGSTGNTNIAGTLTVQDTTQLNLTAGVVHSDNSGVLTSSSIVNSDVSNTAAIDYQKLSLTNSIVNNDINTNAAIEDTKLATISTFGKVANSATTATDSNLPNTIVSRDALGNFSANTILANLTGNVTGAASLNVLKSGDSMTGALNINPGGGTALNITGNSIAPAVVITPTISSKGLSIGSTNDNAIEINTDKFIVVGSSGNTNIAGNLQVDGSTLLNTQLTVSGNTTLSVLSGAAGVVHSDVSGTLSSSQIVNNDIANNTIADNKLASGVTSNNTINSIVKRDASGNFAANNITANLIGNASSATTAGTAANFSGNLLGDVTGTQNTTIVTFVGGQSSTNVASATQLANNATSSNTANTIVRRDASGNFSAGTITAQLTGNVTGSAANNVLKTGDTMTGILNVNTTGNAIRVSDGSVSSPSLAFINENNSGLYRIGSNSIGMSINGTNKAIINNAAGVFASNYRASVYVGTDRTITAANEVVNFNTEIFDSNNN